MHSDTRAWFVAALVLALAGDVFLMLPGDWFVPGLGSFLLAQLGFAVGFSLHAGSGGEYAIAVLIVVVVGVPLVTRFVRALRRAGHGALVGPVVAYFLAISSMVVSDREWRAGAVTGARLFLASGAASSPDPFRTDRPDRIPPQHPGGDHGDVPPSARCTRRLTSSRSRRLRHRRAAGPDPTTANSRSQRMRRSIADA